MITKMIAEMKFVAEPGRRKATKTLFPTSMEYLGVRTPDFRVLIKEWWIEIKNWPPEKLIQFAKELVATRIFECNQLAFELLSKNKNALQSIVSTITLNLRSRCGKGDAARTLMICEKVINDREKLIVKALSWALRELSKSDKPAVERFMEKYDSKIAPLARREIYTKLETGRKNG